MPKYTVYLTTVASTSVEVEAEDKEAAEDAAYEADMPRICAQCSGWGKDYYLELGDEWEVTEVMEEGGGRRDQFLPRLRRLALQGS